MNAVFDEKALMDRVDDDLEFLEEIIEMFDEDCPVQLEKIRRAAAAGDAEAMVQPAHTLKGMLGNFGAASAETAAREIETAGRKNRLADIDAVVEKLQRETEQLRTALSRFLQDRKQ